MLLLDAAEHAPSIWVVLTAREHLTRAECRRHLDQLLKSARRRWPEIQWFVQVEFQRRGALHLNLLIKGVDVGDRQALHELLSERWCARVDAEPVGQWSGEVSEAGGLAKYLAKTLSHGLKREQAPPIGWRGHRTSQTRGYLVRPASVMREEAREARWLQMQLRRAVDEGLTGDEAEDWIDAQLAREGLPEWRVYVEPRRGSAPLPARQMAPVPWFVLEAAWRWQDERELIAEGLQAGPLTPPAAAAGGAANPPPPRGP